MFDGITGQEISLDVRRLKFSIVLAVWTRNFSKSSALGRQIATSDANTLHIVRPLLALAGELATRRLARTLNSNGACVVAMLAGAATPPDSSLRMEVDACIRECVKNHPEVRGNRIPAEKMYEELAEDYRLWRRKSHLKIISPEATPA
jgi:hypothetical protein